MDQAVVFGVGSLSDLPLRYDIPHIIVACLEYLYTTEAYLEEGLFRIGGNVTNVRQLKAKLTFAGDIDEELVPNPHDVTGLIKSFFRELGEPLLTNLLYPEFMTVGSALGQSVCPSLCHSHMTSERTTMVSEDVVRLTSLVAKLPALHRMVLKRILYFVRFVSEFEDVNRMGVTNLATTLGPTLLGKQDDCASDIIMNMATSVSLLSAMLDHFDTIFGEYRTLPFEKRHVNKRKAAKESLTSAAATATTTTAAAAAAAAGSSVEEQGLASPNIKEDDDFDVALPVVMVVEPADTQDSISQQPPDQEELCKSLTVVDV